MRHIGQQAGEPGRARKYRPDFCEDVIECARLGQFPEEWCAFLGVTYGRMWLWRKQYREFKDALDQARMEMEAFWAREAREAVNSKDFRQTALLVEILRKRLPHLWGREGAVDQLHPLSGMILEQDEGTITPEQLPSVSDEVLKERIETLLERRRRQAEMHKVD
jgi:hypothetical protein